MQHINILVVLIGMERTEYYGPIEPMYIEIREINKEYFTMYYVSPYTKSYEIFDSVSKHIIQLRNLTRSNYFVSLYSNDDDNVIHYKDSISLEYPKQFSRGVIRNIQSFKEIVFNVELPRDHVVDDCITISKYEHDDFCDNMIQCMEIMNMYTNERYENKPDFKLLKKEVDNLNKRIERYDHLETEIVESKKELHDAQNTFAYFLISSLAFIAGIIICIYYYFI